MVKKVVTSCQSLLIEKYEITSFISFSLITLIVKFFSVYSCMFLLNDFCSLVTKMQLLLIAMLSSLSYAYLLSFAKAMTRLVFLISFP
jgi:hypothetical protein